MGHGPSLREPCDFSSRVATGRFRHSLTAMLIPARPSATHERKDLSDLPNVSIVLAAELRRAGIATVRDLKKIGAKAAWLRLHRWRVARTLLALEGAILGMALTDLPVGRRAELVDFSTRVPAADDDAETETGDSENVTPPAKP